MLNLVLIKFDYLISDENIRCDAFGVYMDLSHQYTLEQKQKAIGTVWFNSRHGISKGETYIKYEFAEIELFTGEVVSEYFFNCRIDMNKLMIKNLFYPNSMKLAFEKYKKCYQLTQ